jgi:hypothetical protein
MFLTPFNSAKAIGLIQDGRPQYYVARILGFQDVLSKKLSNGFEKPEAILEELSQEEKGLQLFGTITFLF